MFGFSHKSNFSICLVYDAIHEQLPKHYSDRRGS